MTAYLSRRRVSVTQHQRSHIGSIVIDYGKGRRVINARAVVHSRFKQGPDSIVEIDQLYSLM